MDESTNSYEFNSWSFVVSDTFVVSDMLLNYSIIAKTSDSSFS